MQLAIPPGDLGAALSAFSRATDLQVVVDPALIAGKRSAGLSGSFALVDALNRLLAGSGLSFAVEGDTVLVQRAQQVSASQPAASVARVAAADVPKQSVEQSETMEEVVVTAGFANSLARSLDEKRDANNVVDVISAEDIGKFPSQNIAEALQRVPGISITRDRGEGLFVRVRGLGPSFQLVSVNGRDAGELGRFRRNHGRIDRSRL